MYYNLLEETGSLDVYNHIHMFSLHYVYLPKIDRSLQAFRIGWNNYPMRGLSPEQQWVQGLALFGTGTSYATRVYGLLTFYCCKLL